MIIQKILIKIFSEYVGSDSRGNKYYLSKSKDYLGNRKRNVIYSNEDDTTSIPPMWHAWIHYLTDKVPDEEDLIIYQWQRDHTINMTGTSSSYKPVREKISSDYIPWSPKN